MWQWAVVSGETQFLNSNTGGELKLKNSLRGITKIPKFLSQRLQTNTITLIITNNYYSVADPGFSQGGCANSRIGIIFKLFAENCMKMKEFRPGGGGWRGRRVPGDPLRSANAIYH